MVDQAGLRTGQAATIVLLLTAFVIGRGAWWLVAFVGLAQLVGAFGLSFAPFRLLYMALKRANILKPNPQPDHIEPHRFSMKIGTVFNTVAAVALVSGTVTFGWMLVWIVIVLANLNYWAHFCLGCWMYYRFNQWGVPGFTVSAVKQGDRRVAPTTTRDDILEEAHMIERLGIAIALLAMGYFGWQLARCYLLWRAAKNAPSDPLLVSIRRGVPAVLYFTTPTCAPCKYAQQPALAQLRAELGEAIQIIQVDATQDPDAATRWSVQTVPTTFVLDGSGKPRHVNHGVADANKLRQQITTA